MIFITNRVEIDCYDEFHVLPMINIAQTHLRLTSFWLTSYQKIDELSKDWRVSD